MRDMMCLKGVSSEKTMRKRREGGGDLVEIGQFILLTHSILFKKKTRMVWIFISCPVEHMLSHHGGGGANPSL